LKLEFSRQIFEKKPEISSFMNIHPVGADFFHADGQTNDEANNRFAKQFHVLHFLSYSG
jgi:hypothetical protein